MNSNETFMWRKIDYIYAEENPYRIIFESISYDWL